MLVLARHLPAVWATYRGGEATRIEQASDYLELYTRFTGVELGGLTVGLVGLGAVGREVAARLAAFKARVLAYDPYVQEPPPGVDARRSRHAAARLRHRLAARAGDAGDAGPALAPSAWRS